jgi:hypothetical protein
MWRKFENAIEHEGSALEEAVTPIPSPSSSCWSRSGRRSIEIAPAVILDDIVGFSLDPEIEANQGDTPYPPGTRSRCEHSSRQEPYLIIWTKNERPSGTRKQENANMQYERKSLAKISIQR